MQCFVCSQVVQGDDRFVEFHLNQYLSPLDGTAEEQRSAHVEACLVSKEVETTEGYSTRREDNANVDEDDLAAASHGRAEDESEMKGRQVAAGGRTKPKREEEVDTVHELAVNSTPDLIYLLAHALNASHASPHGRTSEAYLTSNHVEHVSTRLKDYGWGCGYKNAQMLYSSFRHIPHLQEVLRAGSKSPGKTARSVPPLRNQEEVAAGEETGPIPPIRWWQESIEAAWKQGYDPMGAAHFKHRLVDSRRWIGTTEIFTALSYTGVQTLIVDFPKSKRTNGTNQNLVNFIVDYFRTPNFLGTAPADPAAPGPAPARPSSPAGRNAFEVLASGGGTAVHCTGKQPLYLQHHGHSRTIVGIEIGKRSKVDAGPTASAGAGSGAEVGGGQGMVKSRIRSMGVGGKNGRGRDRLCGSEGGNEEEEVWLLLFDPGKPIPHEFKKAAASLGAAARQPARPATSPASGSDSGAVKGTDADDSPRASKKPRGRFGFGAATSSRTTPPPAALAQLPKFGEVLKLFRVNMHELKKKDDYQVLFIDPNAAPLSPEQQAAKKRVTSMTIEADSH
ncbi:hypothetical protein JCM3774_006056 [Rhodotorula dairenensis]